MLAPALRAIRNDCQSGGHGERRFRTAICRRLGCAPGDEQYVPIDQRHIRRLGIKYLFEVDGYFLNSSRRLAQDLGSVQSRSAVTAAGQCQSLEHAEAIVLDPKAAGTGHIADNVYNPSARNNDRVSGKNIYTVLSIFRQLRL